MVNINKYSVCNKRHSNPSIVVYEYITFYYTVYYCSGTTFNIRFFYYLIIDFFSSF